MKLNLVKRRFVPVTPLLTVDTVILYMGKLVFIKRKNDPFKGHFALPGGFVEVGETVETAAVREAKEETGLDVDIIKLLGVYSEPSRDPRGHTVSVCFLALGRGNLKAGSDALDTGLFGINEIPELAFDHNKIIKKAMSDINGILSEMQKHDDARKERF
ncbi:MAG: NUDIX hydrolase [Candidatus Methanoperedens sp.]|nr:MAG: NUDIX hydrolase [Candidatus Methanoperedens sp.]